MLEFRLLSSLSFNKNLKLENNIDSNKYIGSIEVVILIGYNVFFGFGKKFG